MTKLLGGLAIGAAAGAAGTTALNAVTYLDMAVRGRPSSSTPQDTVEKLAAKADVQIPGADEPRDNRVSGLGPLLGLVTGVGVGALAGGMHAAGLRPPAGVSALLVGAAAMAGSVVPMTALGVTDPSKWRASDWLSDAIPHLAYGAVVVATVRALDPDHGGRIAARATGL
ncbi:MAG: hypothetical protein DLM56_04050 [Pseudonocardiales bacterium]|nr:MAG: hypothetical protein DLM56_04050 [Pseudonocardiales bacterium]